MKKLMGLTTLLALGLALALTPALAGQATAFLSIEGMTCAS